jgi:hypothetical protein
MTPSLKTILTHADRIMARCSHALLPQLLGYARGLPRVGEGPAPEILGRKRGKVSGPRGKRPARGALAIEVVLPVQVSDDGRSIIAVFSATDPEPVRHYMLQVLLTLRSMRGHLLVPGPGAGLGRGRYRRIALLPVTLPFRNGHAQLDLKGSDVARRLHLSPADRHLLAQGLPPGALWDPREVKLRLLRPFPPLDTTSLKRILEAIYLTARGDADCRMPPNAQTITAIPRFAGLGAIEERFMALLGAGDAVVERVLIGALVCGAKDRPKQHAPDVRIYQAAFNVLNKVRLGEDITLPGILRYLFADLSRP